MTLKLEQISQMVGGQMNLYPLNLTLVPNAVTVLLGATRSLNRKKELVRVTGFICPLPAAAAVASAEITPEGLTADAFAALAESVILADTGSRVLSLNAASRFSAAWIWASGACR